MNLFPGDVLKPPDAHPDVRFRVRYVETVHKLGPWLKPLGTVKVYVLQLFSVESPGNWRWMDRSHDRRATLEQVKAWGFTLEIPAPDVQLDLFS